LKKVVVKNPSGKIEPLQMIEKQEDNLSEFDEEKPSKVVFMPIKQQ
jgi:hypothetical protein